MITPHADRSRSQAGIGHLVLNVTDVQRSARFYCDVLGMRKGRGGVFNGERMVFLTFGQRDHDLGLVELPHSARVVDPGAVGLGHVAFRIGDQMGELRRFKQHLEYLGVVPEQLVEHLYARSIYFRDPDGIALEVYVDCETNTPFVEAEMQVDNLPLRLE